MRTRFRLRATFCKTGNTDGRCSLTSTETSPHSVHPYNDKFRTNLRLTSRRCRRNMRFVFDDRNRETDLNQPPHPHSALALPTTEAVTANHWDPKHPTLSNRKHNAERSR